MAPAERAVLAEQGAPEMVPVKPRLEHRKPERQVRISRDPWARVERAALALRELDHRERARPLTRVIGAKAIRAAMPMGPHRRGTEPEHPAAALREPGLQERAPRGVSSDQGGVGLRAASHHVDKDSQLFDFAA